SELFFGALPSTGIYLYVKSTQVTISWLRPCRYQIGANDTRQLLDLTGISISQQRSSPLIAWQHSRFDLAFAANWLQMCSWRYCYHRPLRFPHTKTEPTRNSLSFKSPPPLPFIALDMANIPKS